MTRRATNQISYNRACWSILTLGSVLISPSVDWQDQHDSKDHPCPILIIRSSQQNKFNFSVRVWPRMSTFGQSGNKTLPSEKRTEPEWNQGLRALRGHKTHSRLLSRRGPSRRDNRRLLLGPGSGLGLPIVDCC